MTGLRYRELAETLRERITLGEYGPAGALESEAELGRRYGLSRMTVRRALEELRNEGILKSRRGSGWSIAVLPVQEALGVFPTAADAAASAGHGRIHERKILEFEFTTPPPSIRAALGSGTEGALRVLGLNLVDRVPFDLVATWMPDDVGAKLSREDFSRVGGWVALREHGIELLRTTQSVAASVASATDARLLSVRRGSPLLVLHRVAYDGDQRAITASEHRYVGHLVRFDLEFRGIQAASHLEPPGLRLAGSRPISRARKSG